MLQPALAVGGFKQVSATNDRIELGLSVAHRCRQLIGIQSITALHNKITGYRLAVEHLWSEKAVVELMQVFTVEPHAKAMRLVGGQLAIGTALTTGALS